MHNLNDQNSEDEEYQSESDDVHLIFLKSIKNIIT